jgi:hypothetical protein
VLLSQGDVLLSGFHVFCGEAKCPQLVLSHSLGGMTCEGREEKALACSL